MEATSAWVSVTLTWVAVVNEVVRDDPLTSITVEGSNPVPVTATTADDIPAASLFGLMLVIVGTGLSISRLTGVPELLTVPFITITPSRAPFVIWLAGTVAVSCVELT